MAHYSIMVVMDKKPEGPKGRLIREGITSDFWILGVCIGCLIALLFYSIVINPHDTHMESLVDDCIARGGKIYRDAYIVARSIDGAIGMVKESNKCMVVDHD